MCFRSDAGKKFHYCVIKGKIGSNFLVQDPVTKVKWIVDESNTFSDSYRYNILERGVAEFEGGGAIKTGDRVFFAYDSKQSPAAATPTELFVGTSGWRYYTLDGFEGFLLATFLSWPAHHGRV